MRGASCDTSLPSTSPATRLAAALWRADATRFLVSGSTGGVLAALGDVAGLAAVAHAHGLPLLVDEAHGAHLGLHPSFPASALACGADVVVQSTHKTLGALTQAAVLHVRGGRVDLDRLDQALQALGLDGPAAAAWLEAEAGVVLEMSTPRAVVAAFGIGSAAGDGDALVEGLWALSRARWDPGRAARCAAGTGPSEPSLTPPPLPEVVLAPREALARRTTAVPLVASLGRVAAEAVCPYPPGIPLQRGQARA
ncbi:Uncharacterized protein YaaO [Auxenochlorella protothecoides]|uniref:Uncharacterized protein YaaO n=1 Tax=Auxenochlorella protothecoides TaxID=3075 RepID=A0A087SKU1_AUXPR|nr:Uncharacterized protein YaaO [Auxenochlorella protothecoides]KFM26345.1 Uncharacterized protein YaaO [Auxenochlorella protothecoides]